MRNLQYKSRTDKLTNRRSGLNFESSLAMMAVYLHVKSEVNWSKGFLGKKTNLKATIRQMDRLKSNTSML